MKIQLLIIFNILLVSCVNDTISTESKIKCQAVILIPNDYQARFDKTIIVYEDSNYVIKSPLNNFISDLTDFLYDYSSYLSTVDSLLADAENTDILKASEYFAADRIPYLTALIIQKGDCYVYSKKNQKPILDCCIELWGGCVPLAGAGGRRIYFDNILFIETVDYMC